MARQQLHQLLKTILTTTHPTSKVYFTPPDTLRITEYPCIIYNLNGAKDRKANNINYNMRNRYLVKYISSNPDDELLTALRLQLPYCRFINQIPQNGLYQTSFETYI